jgi:hypothetical protein
VTAPIRDALTRRRLGGAVLVLAGLVVATIVLWPGGGDKPAVAVRLVTVPELGLAFGHPSSWSRTITRRVLRLRSPDRSAVMIFASVGGRRAGEVKATLKRALRKRYAPAEIVRDGPGRLGTRKVRTFELVGFANKQRLRALVLVDNTAYRTYAITLLTPAKPSRRRLVEVQAILNSVQLSRPVRPKFDR